MFFEERILRLLCTLSIRIFKTYSDKYLCFLHIGWVSIWWYWLFPSGRCIRNTQTSQVGRCPNVAELRAACGCVGRRASRQPLTEFELKQHVVDRTPPTWLRFATLEDTHIWYYCIDLRISLSVLPMQKVKQQNPLIEIVIKGHSWKCCCLYDPHPALQEDEMDLWVLPVETHEHPWIPWWVFLWWPVTQKILISRIQEKPAVTIQCVVAFCCATLSSLVNCETWTCLQPTSPASERLEHPNVCRNYIHTSNGQPRRWKWFIRFHPHHHFRFLVQRP